jgi:hypothetical protein
MRIAPGAVALRIPLFETQGPAIDVEEGTTTIPAALGALSARLHHRLQLISSIAGGLQRAGWELHIEGDVLLATRLVDPRHALEILEEDGLAGPLCAVADLDDSGWPRLYAGLELVT